MAEPTKTFNPKFGQVNQQVDQEEDEQVEPLAPAEIPGSGGDVLKNMLNKGGIQMKEQSPLKAFGKQLLNRTKIGSAVNAYNEQQQINKANKINQGLTSGGKFEYQRADGPTYVDAEGNAITDTETINKLNQQTGFTGQYNTMAAGGLKSAGLVKLVDADTGEVLNAKEVMVDLATEELGPDGQPITKQVKQTIYVNPDQYLADPQLRQEIVTSKIRKNMESLGIDTETIDRTINNISNISANKELQLATANFKLKTLKSEAFTANLGVGIPLSGNKSSSSDITDSTSTIVDDFYKATGADDATIPEGNYTVKGMSGNLSNSSGFIINKSSDDIIKYGEVTNPDTQVKFKGYINVRELAKEGSRGGVQRVGGTAQIGTSIGVYIKSDGDNISETDFGNDNWAETADTQKKLRMAVELGIINQAYVDLPYAERMQFMKSVVTMMDSDVLPQLRSFMAGMTDKEKGQFANRHNALGKLASQKAKLESQIKQISELAMVSGEGKKLLEEQNTIEGTGIFANQDNPGQPKYTHSMEIEGYSEELSFDLIDSRISNMSRENAGRYLDELVETGVLKPQAADFFARKLDFVRSKTSKLSAELDKINAAGGFGNIQSAYEQETGKKDDGINIMGANFTSTKNKIQLQRGRIAFDENTGKFSAVAGSKSTLGSFAGLKFDPKETVITSNAGYKIMTDFGKLKDRGYNDVTRSEYLSVIKKKVLSDDAETRNKIREKFGLEEADFQVVVDMFTNNSTDEVIEILDDIMEIAQKPRLDATEGLYKGFQ